MTGHPISSAQVFGKFFSEQSGAVAIVFSFSLVMIISIAGVSIDYGRARVLQTKLQLTLDNAVLAGVRGSLDAAALAGQGEESDENKIKVAQVFFKAKNLTMGNIGEATFAFQGENLVGNVHASIDTSLLKVVGLNSFDVSTTSVATITPEYKPLCFMAMHPYRKHTLELKQSVSVIAPKCHIYGNSNHYDDVVDPHTPQNHIVGKSVQAIGFGHHYIENVTPPLEHAPELISDPLADLVIPAIGACDHNSKSVSGETTTLNPGTYCGGLEITGGSNVTFNPGVYIIAGAKFELDSSSINGVDVTIVLADDKAELDWKDSVIRLSAPAIGEYASMVMIGVRASTDHEFDASTIDLHGIVYLINGEFIWTNAGTPAITSKWTAWIVDGVSWRGDGEVHINFNLKDSHIPYPSGLNVIPRPGYPRLLS